MFSGGIERDQWHKMGYGIAIMRENNIESDG